MKGALSMMAIICLVLSVILTIKMGKVFFKNTIGTTYAYAVRYMLLFFVIMIVLAGICRKMGLM